KEQIEKMPLSADQEKQLFEVLVQERANTPGSTIQEHMKWKLDLEAHRNVLSAQELMYQQIRSRAAAFLDAAQLEALAKYQDARAVSANKKVEISEAIFGQTNRADSMNKRFHSLPRSTVLLLVAAVAVPTHCHI